MNDTTVAEEASGLCPRLDAAAPVDVTFYRRFLACVHAKQPGRYVTFPLKTSSGAAPAKADDGDGKPSWTLVRIPQTRKETYLSKNQKTQLAAKSAEATDMVWKAFGKRADHPYWAVGIEYEQRYECQGCASRSLVGHGPTGTVSGNQGNYGAYMGEARRTSRAD